MTFGNSNPQPVYGPGWVAAKPFHQSSLAVITGHFTFRHPQTSLAQGGEAAVGWMPQEIYGCLAERISASRTTFGSTRYHRHSSVPMSTCITRCRCSPGSSHAVIQPARLAVETSVRLLETRTLP